MMNEGGMSPLQSSNNHSDDTEEDLSRPLIVAGKRCITRTILSVVLRVLCRIGQH